MVEYTEKVFELISEESLALLQGMLARRPSQRLTIDQLIDLIMSSALLKLVKSSLSSLYAIKADNHDIVRSRVRQSMARYKPSSKLKMAVVRVGESRRVCEIDGGVVCGDSMPADVIVHARCRLQKIDIDKYANSSSTENTPINPRNNAKGMAGTYSIEATSDSGKKTAKLLFKKLDIRLHHKSSL